MSKWWAIVLGVGGGLHPAFLLGWISWIGLSLEERNLLTLTLLFNAFAIGRLNHQGKSSS